MTDSNTELTRLAQEAKALHARLETLWADDGVEQLDIFLDPEITDVLKEIRRLSMEFIAKVARLDE